METALPNPKIGPTAMDRLELYRWAVQDPETHAVVLRTMYQRLRPGRQPVVLREDFAGTSAESVAWVILQHGRHAIAVDLDGPTLEWAQRRAARLLGALASEIAFVQGDARSIGPPEVAQADIIAVLNYSILYQREPDELLSYLRHASNGLAPGGILVFNLFGGAAAIEPGAAWCPTPACPPSRPSRPSSISGKFAATTAPRSGSTAASISSSQTRLHPTALSKCVTRSGTTSGHGLSTNLLRRALKRASLTCRYGDIPAIRREGRPACSSDALSRTACPRSRSGAPTSLRATKSLKRADPFRPHSMSRR